MQPEIVDQEELEREKQNRSWWSQFEPLMGLKLHSWTDRRHATFFDSNGQPFYLPQSVAEHLLRFLTPEPPCDCGMRSAKFCRWMQREQGKCLSTTVTPD